MGKYYQSLRLKINAEHSVNHKVNMWVEMSLEIIASDRLLYISAPVTFYNILHFLACKGVYNKSLQWLRMKSSYGTQYGRRLLAFHDSQSMYITKCFVILKCSYPTQAYQDKFHLVHSSIIWDSDALVLSGDVGSEYLFYSPFPLQKSCFWIIPK